MLNKRERREKNCMMSDLSSCQLFSASSLGQTHLIASHRAASQNSWEDPKIPANRSLSSIHEKSFQYVKLQYVKTWGGNLIRMKRRWVHMSLERRQTTGIMFGIYSSLRDSGGYGGIYTSKQWFSCCAEVEQISQTAFSYTPRLLASRWNFAVWKYSIFTLLKCTLLQKFWARFYFWKEINTFQQLNVILIKGECQDI